MADPASRRRHRPQPFRGRLRHEADQLVPPGRPEIDRPGRALGGDGPLRPVAPALAGTGGQSAVVRSSWALGGGAGGVRALRPNILGRFLPRRRLKLDESWPAGAEGDWTFADEAPTEAAMVRRSISVLENYLRRTTGVSGPDAPDSRAGASRIPGGQRKNDADRSRRELSPPAMSEAEALEILGLRPEADSFEINEAHRRLIQIVHPDRGGSAYFAVKVNQAKEILLSRAWPQSGPGASAAPRKRRRRDAQAREFSQPKPARGR